MLFVSLPITRKDEDVGGLTLQLGPGDTIPECKTSVGSTCAKGAFSFMETDIIDCENVLRAGRA
jgi:hypothetical protein